MTTLARYHSSIAVVIFNPDNQGEVIAKKASAVVYITRKQVGNVVTLQPLRYVRYGRHRIRVFLDERGQPVIRLSKENFLRLFQQER